MRHKITLNMDTPTTFPAIDSIYSDLPANFQREELERCGLEFDKDGHPVWYTVAEWIDELDRKLSDHFGDEYRKLANKRRSRRNTSEPDLFVKSQPATSDERI